MAIRAKKGGETAVNGEFYRGGAFMPERNNPKGVGSKKNTLRKVQIEPGLWVESDKRSIMGAISAFIDWEEWHKNKRVVLTSNFDAFVKFQRMNDKEISDITRLVDGFRNGARFLDEVNGDAQ
jgi:hypothetical protein